METWKPAVAGMEHVADFYDGKTIFMTGATGFVGKVLLDRLLRHCPGIVRIYVIVRALKGATAAQRHETLVNSKAFDKVRAKDPTLLQKLILVEGELSKEGFGLSPENTREVCDNCTVFFHNAATVKLKDRLRYTANVNLKGTQQALNLVHKFKKVDAMIVTSTTYVEHFHKAVVEEEIPELKRIHPQYILDCNEWMSDREILALENTLVSEGNWQSMYVFTKHLSEIMVQERAAGLPIVIVRPPGVNPALREPMPGWTDSLGSCVGVYHPFMLGLTTGYPTNQTHFVNHAPVDLCCNLLVAAGWFVAKYRPPKIPVFAISQCGVNQNTWNDGCRLLKPIIEKNPSRKTMGTIKLQYARMPCLRQKMALFYDYYIYAFFWDVMLRLKLGKPWRQKQLRNAIAYGMAASEITDQRSVAKSDNTQTLRTLLTAEDQQTFYFDMREVDWPSYYVDFWRGVKQFLYKESPDPDPAAVALYRRLVLLRRAARVSVAVAVMAGLVHWVPALRVRHTAFRNKLLEVMLIQVLQPTLGVIASIRGLLGR